MDASLLNTNFGDLTPGGNFDLTWTETKGGIKLYLQVVEDGETQSNYLILIEETHDDTKSGLTYSRGWNVPINLRLNSKCQFTIQQKSNYKVFNFPESSTIVLTNEATTRTDPSPSILPTCTGLQVNCLPPISSSTHLTGIVTSISTVPGFTTPIAPSRLIPPVEVSSPITTTGSDFASTSFSTNNLVPTKGVTPSASPISTSSSTPSAAPVSQGLKKNTVVAIGVGTGAGILAFFFVVFFLLRYRYRKRHPPLKTKEAKPQPSVGDPKLFPNQKLEDSSMDSSGVTRKDLFSIYGSLEENNRTGGGVINGTVRRPSQMMTTTERGFGVREYGDDASQRPREISGYDSIYSQDSMMGEVGMGERGEVSFDGRRETSFGKFI